MQGRIKSIGKYAGYAFFTVFLTLYLMFLTFPYPTLTDRFLPVLKQRLPGTVSWGDIRATPSLWLKVSKVEAGGGDLSAPVLLELENLRLRPAFLSLLLGKPALSLKAELYQGSARGTIGRRKEALEISLSWKQLKTAKHPLVSQFGGNGMAASLSGDLDLRVIGSNWETSEGSLRLTLEDGSWQNPQIQGFTLPSLDALTGKAGVKLGQKKAELESFSLEGSQFSASLEGKIDLFPRLAASRLNLNGKLKLAGELASQYDAILNGFLRNKSPEGFHTFSLRGTLASPRFSL